MNGVFHIGATGLRAHQNAVDVIANNIANLNTTAYKRVAVSFSEMVNPAVQPTQLGQVSNQHSNLPTLLGVSADATSRVFTQGDTKTTGNPLDIAIRGDGLFELMGPAGQTLLWRGGTLRVNSEGFLSNSNGIALKPQISVPRDASNLTINSNGQVFVTVSGQSGAQEIGQIDLVLVNDGRSLDGIGDGLYKIANENPDLLRAPPGEEGAGILAQGFLETSNVQLSDELVSLMLLQRAYAANARIVQAGDDLMGIVNGLKR
jgi:flagellar basal-body rod protein FlgG